MKRCPYYSRHRDKFLYCEDGVFRIKFPDKDMRRKWIYGRCFSLYGFEECPLKKELDSYRKK